jgi:hypothetical protein
MRLVLAVLGSLGALGLGLVLGVSALSALGAIPPHPLPLLVAVIGYAAIGGAVLAMAPPRFGVFLLLGWAAPWLLVGLVVVTADFLPFLPFPGIITAVYVLALCLAFYRAGRRRQGMVAEAGSAAERPGP